MSEHIFPTDGRSTVYVTKTEGISDCETALEEIIRCRECKYFDDNYVSCNYFICGYWDSENEEDVLMRQQVNPNGFCSWAERREV